MAEWLSERAVQFYLQIGLDDICPYFHPSPEEQFPLRDQAYASPSSQAEDSGPGEEDRTKSSVSAAIRLGMLSKDIERVGSCVDPCCLRQAAGRLF